MLLLEVEHLTVAYGDAKSGVIAVRDVSFQLQQGEFLGIVGESGSGKSTLGYAISRLLRPPGNIVGGRVSFLGTDLLSLSPKQLRRLRWSDISIVMQSSMNALNPVLSIRRQFEDTFQAHTSMTRKEIEDAFMNRYPHELSGGMKQRVSIALALALRPKLIIFDEPTTALDVVVQRSIVQNLKRLQKEYGFAALFISHDLGTVLEIADRVAVMYAGEFVEIQAAEQILSQPIHPYTEALLRCFPDPQSERIEIMGIPGKPPNLKAPPEGCPFAPRCEKVEYICRVTKPNFVEAGGIGAACHLANINTMGCDAT
jgi:oligopeptide/dipeptide ABC transporter ATP-binding protein